MTQDLLRHGGTIGHLMTRSFQRWSALEAVVDDQERLTYAMFAERVARMIAVFDEIGLNPGSGIALLSSNRVDVLTAYAAAFIQGIRLTPMSALGSEDDQAFILSDGEIDALLVDNVLFAARGQQLKRRVSGLRHLLSLGPQDGAIDLVARMADANPLPLSPKATPHDIAVIGYTSGTTGLPKGVVHTHASLLACVMLMSAEWEWPSVLRLLAATPVSHAAGVMALPVILRGGAFHMLKSFDAPQFLAYVAAEKITATFLVPTMIYRLLDCAGAAEVDLSSLQAVIYGAAPMSPTRLQEALRIFGPVFMQLYGQSEAPNCITYLGRENHDPFRTERMKSCGLPLVGVDVSLRDEADREVPVGDVGEICVRGPHVMREYWKRPSDTDACIYNGWLHTGDMGKFDVDGFLYIVDRKKDMIISGGFNIFSKEVEDAISQHDGVAFCAVIGVPDPVWGEAVTAVVVPREGYTIDVEQLVAFVKERKGVVAAPKKVYVRSAIPLTPLGKPDKKALRAEIEPLFSV